MEELIKDLLKYFKPERFPIVVIIAYILLAIILNNSHPYKKQQDKIEILKSLQSVSKDTTLTKQINNDYLKILLSLDQGCLSGEVSPEYLQGQWYHRSAL